MQSDLRGGVRLIVILSVGILPNTGNSLKVIRFEAILIQTVN
jgi:hypothetical protein